jgi:ATP-dependent RNA helicase SUPV3L1/SUV3
VIEDLQRRVQVQREAAVLLAQRIEVLSTKSWQDAQACLSLARGCGAVAGPGRATGRPIPIGPASTPNFRRCWTHPKASCWWFGMRFRRLWRWQCVPREDGAAPLPPVPVWADELRVARGVPAESPGQAAKPKIDPQVRAQATAPCARCWLPWSWKSPKAMAKPAPVRPMRACACAQRIWQGD